MENKNQRFFNFTCVSARSPIETKQVCDSPLLHVIPRVSINANQVESMLVVL